MTRRHSRLPAFAAGLLAGGVLAGALAAAAQSVPDVITVNRFMGLAPNTAVTIVCAEPQGAWRRGVAAQVGPVSMTANGATFQMGTVRCPS